MIANLLNHCITGTCPQYILHGPTQGGVQVGPGRIVVSSSWLLGDLLLQFIVLHDSAEALHRRSWAGTTNLKHSCQGFNMCVNCFRKWRNCCALLKFVLGLCALETTAAFGPVVLATKWISHKQSLSLLIMMRIEKISYKSGVVGTFNLNYLT